MTLLVRAATDVGLKRARNEDRHGIWIPDGQIGRDRGALLVVADGMGGATAGEVASQLAVDCVMRHYREAQGPILEDLRDAIEEANREIHEHSVAHPELAGMGTTCSAVVVRVDEVSFAHVGDSRVYLVRAGAIHQLTQDHSLVAQLVQHRHLTPEQARLDPRRNVVTRSVGVGLEVEVDASSMDGLLEPGDTLVLSTDGLHGFVEDEEIVREASRDDLDRACRVLIDLANQRGGFDNITVVIARRED